MGKNYYLFKMTRCSGLLIRKSKSFHPSWEILYKQDLSLCKISKMKVTNWNSIHLSKRNWLKRNLSGHPGWALLCPRTLRKEKQLTLFCLNLPILIGMSRKLNLGVTIEIILIAKWIWSNKIAEMGISIARCLTPISSQPSKQGNQLVATGAPSRR